MEGGFHRNNLRMEFKRFERKFPDEFDELDDDAVDGGGLYAVVEPALLFALGLKPPPDVPPLLVRPEPSVGPAGGCLLLSVMKPPKIPAPAVLPERLPEPPDCEVVGAFPPDEPPPPPLVGALEMEAIGVGASLV